MDFGIIYQLKIKKFWWLDAILYGVSALLLAAVLCFAIFSVKISLQEKKISELDGKIADTGTSEQKETEKIVFEYQKKIDDFALLFVDHKLPTNIFKMLERDTLPNVWMSSFLTSAEQANLAISGEAENLNALSRQIDIFETNKFIKNIDSLSTSPNETGRIKFDVKFTLDKDIFSSQDFSVPVLETTSPSTGLFLNPNIF